MLVPHRHIKKLLCASVVLTLGMGSAIAQSYPNKPIKFLVGFTAGSATDVVARIVAGHVSRKLGQPVVVDNRTGANGMVAAAELARAQPDGYTVLISNSSSITVNPLLYKKMQYDVFKDFAPVTLIVSAPFIFNINPENPRTASVANLGDLMKLAREKPGQLSYGTAGAGNLGHLAWELLNYMAGVRMVHVPYRGTPPAQIALLGKEIETMADNPTSVPHIKAGKAKALAVTTAKRWRDLPDVPSIAESGYAGYDISYWSGVLVPAGTSPEVIKTLYEAVKSTADDATTKAALLQHGNIEMLTPQEVTARVKAETDLYSQIIKRANIQLE